jgi:hypothetical protein
LVYNLKRSDHLSVLSINERIILKWVSKELGVEDLKWIDLSLGAGVMRFFNLWIL